jgi:hypothetical protein
MKSSFRLFCAILAMSLACGAAYAHSTHSAEHESDSSATPGLVPVSDQTDAAWLAKARADYPLNSCVVSEDKFEGEESTPKDFIYRRSGQPDRLVRFCCRDCAKDFAKDPAKFLKSLDEAAAAKTKPHST